MTQVWVVYADNHDYDAMSQWLVGVFTTEEAAQRAADAEPERHSKRDTLFDDADKVNVSVEPCELDQVIEEPDV